MINKMPVLITTDSVCDLPKELIDDLPIAVNPYYVQTETGKFMDGVEISSEDIILYMEDGNYNVKSVSPSVEQYKDFFSKQSVKAERIIHITMGMLSSQGYQNALEATENIPQITIIDSTHISSGLGLVVLKAAKLADEGCDADYIINYIEKYKTRVSSSFVVRDTEFLYQSGRLPKVVKHICDRFLLHPLLGMKNSKITVTGILRGQWKAVIRTYVRKTLKHPGGIDTQQLILTNAGLDQETLNTIKELVQKRVPFKKIYVQQASASISCNCGKGTFGLLFSRKEKSVQLNKNTETVKKGNWFLNVLNFLERTLMKEEYSIQQKLLHLIFFAALIGGSISMVLTALAGAWGSAITIAGILVVVVGALLLSAGMNQKQLAGVMIGILANVVFFPLMFFTSGGIYSGMPIWLVLGLIFDWLVLTGPISYIIYVISFIASVAAILFAQAHPEYVTVLDEGYMVPDVIQSILIVSLIFGIIFKYQTYLYEKQRAKIKEHEEELLAANNAKSQFLAHMSHEIRTPINGIIGMDTMLLRECADNETISEYAMNIQSASQSLLAIVNDILDISKIESGKLEIIPVEYDLFSVLNDCYNMNASRAIDKGLEFFIHADPSIPSGLYGDEVRIRQIINNLLSNAVKYTKQGQIELSIGMQKKTDAIVYLSISVRDTGTGIKKEDLGRLFESFVRVDEEKNRNIEGTGLGLNLTQNLVQMMGGTITVDSVYNQGSTFRVVVPQEIRKRAPIGDFTARYQELLKEENQTLETIYAPTAKVLVVDDVPMNLLVVKGLMKNTQIQVETAENGARALEKTMETKYDLIFLDHLMPQMDGIECFHEMKKAVNSPNSRTPVIILTANAIIGAKQEYLDAGFSDYLAKPIIEKELIAILKKYLPGDKIVTAECMIVTEKTQVSTTEQMVPVAETQTSTAEQVVPVEVIQTSTTEQAVSIKNEPKNPDTSEAPMDILKNCGMVNVEKGLSFCMQDEDFYMEILKEYYHSDREDNMIKYFEEKDWENYRIIVHALKSASMTIGAEDLSEKAKALEMACKENRIVYVEEHHQQVLEEYRHFTRNILAKVLRE